MIAASLREPLRAKLLLYLPSCKANNIVSAFTHAGPTQAACHQYALDGFESVGDE